METTLKMSKRLEKNKVTDILNSVSPGASYRNIAELSKTSASSVFHILRDFPLWAFLKDKPNEDEE